MKWKKFGLIFNPNIIADLGFSASLVPIVEILDNLKGIIRVYYSPRDKQNRSVLMYFDININNPTEILYFSKEPLFTGGNLGAFDDNGVIACSFVEFNEKKFLYYQGWNLTVTVPFISAIGIAEVKNDKIIRLGEGPIITRNLNEPHSCASPFVLYDEGIYKMWYVSLDKWIMENGSPKHYYDIKYAESQNGIDWKRFGKGVISYENDKEYAFGRPFVIKENGIYKMWYCFRGGSYRIGYAESKNGKEWVRKDDLMNFDVSNEGWDSEMLAYPCILDVKGERYLFYNGNDYGKSGIGLAKLEL